MDTKISVNAALRYQMCMKRKTDCRLLSMTGLNHAKASMILVVMLDPSMTVRPVKLS